MPLGKESMGPYVPIGEQSALKRHIRKIAPELEHLSPKVTQGGTFYLKKKKNWELYMYIK